MPIAIASRSCSTASAGPSVSTADSPPCASTSRIASSTPHSSCGLIVNPRCASSSACSSAVSTIWPPVSGHALHADQDLHRTGSSCVSSGSNSGVGADDGDGHRVALVHVLDRSSCRPRPRARAAGRRAAGTCRATGRRRRWSRTSGGPCASTMRSPSRGEDRLARRAGSASTPAARRVVVDRSACTGSRPARSLAVARGTPPCR